MYKTVREAGKFVMIHSCGDVDELFDDLIELGVNCFNPFQPEGEANIFVSSCKNHKINKIHKQFYKLLKLVA